MTQDDLDARLNSYSHRQLVVVTADEIVAATRAAEESAKEARDAPLWTDIANAAINAMRPWAFNFIDLTAKAVESWANARQRGLNVLQISRSEASRLVFPPGHPRDGVLYIGHPALPHVYYAASSFHRIAFEHKFSEAIDLLMHLGATEIRVEHVRGWSREFAARLSVPLPSAADELTASARAKSADSNNILYEARLRGSDQPALPSTLVWYPHEPTWQVIAQGRLRFGLRDFSLSVNYDDDFGVDAGLGMSAQKSGLELGGKFEGHEATTWKVVGKFAGG